MDKSLFGFNVDFTAGSGRNLLILTRKSQDDTPVVDYQVEMIAHNELPGILKFHVIQKDKELQFQYDTDGMVSLANFLKRQVLSKGQFLSVLDKIISVIQAGKNYFLDNRNFILDERFIYINPRLLQVSLVYLPVNTTQEVMQNLRSLVVNLVINTAGIESHDNIIRQLLAGLKNDEFNLTDFSRKVKDLKSESVPEPDSRNSLTTTGTGEFSGKSRKNCLLPNLPKWGGYLLARGAAVFGLLFLPGARPLIKGNSSSCTEVKASQPSQLNKYKVEIESKPVSDDTVLLDKQVFPLLKAINGEEEIVINKNEFSLGRNTDTCDYSISSMNIGRAHAVIKKVNGNYFISDLDSKNGTFLNGSRLISNKEYELKHNDKVTLADIEYCYIQEYI